MFGFFSLLNILSDASAKASVQPYSSLKESVLGRDSISFTPFARDDTIGFDILSLNHFG